MGVTILGTLMKRRRAGKNIVEEPEGQGSPRAVVPVETLHVQPVIHGALFRRSKVKSELLLS